MASVFLLLLWSASGEDCSQICAGQSNNCVLENERRFCDATLAITTTFLIDIKNSTFYCVQVENSGEPNCTIQLRSSSIVIRKSMLMASFLKLTAKTINITADSVLSANGTGYQIGPGNAGDSNAPSYGGRGGGTCGELSRFLTYGDQYDPRSFYGSGANTRGSNGGGQILIEAQNMSFSGVITACGNLPENNTALGTPIKYPAFMSGGTGGTIYINITSVADVQMGLILANGGNGGDEGYGGGGGRIALYGGPFNKAKIKAKGGVGRQKRCPIGGAGTIYIAVSDTLIVDNNVSPTRNPTPVNTRETMTLQVENNAFVTPVFSHQPISVKNLHVSGSRIEVSQVAGSGYVLDSVLLIQVQDGIFLSNQGTIGSSDTDSVNISAMNLFSDSSSGIYFGSSLNLNVTVLISFKGDIEGNVLMSEKSIIQIHCLNFTLLNDGSMKAEKIGIMANDIQIEGSVNAAESTCSDDIHHFEENPPFHYILGPPGNETVQVDINLHRLLSSHFTTVLIGGSHLNLKGNSKVVGGRIAIFGRNMTLEGVLSSSGLGCSSETGIGHGSAREKMCSGSGGGYGGSGGAGKPLSQNFDAVCAPATSGGQAYSDVNNPWFEGSGGGSVPRVGGGGGGFIDIEAFYQVNISGLIAADGEDAPRDPSDLRSGSGGGSGGGVFLMARNVTWSGGKISANGGRGSILGGGGGGGRVLFKWFGDVVDGEAVNVANFSKILHGFGVDTTGGLSGESRVQETDGRGKNGTVVAATCRPGSSGYLCKSCGVGEYKPGPKFQLLCNVCTNKPAAARYTNMGVESSTCPYECPTGYTPAKNNLECMSPLEEFFDVFGGVAGALAFFICILVVMSLLPLGVFMCYKKYRTQSILRLQSALISPLDSIGQYERKLPMKKTENPVLNREDLPFHERRIFLLGDNTFYKPWALPKAPISEMESEVVLEQYSEFATEVNNRTRWYSWQHTLCIVLLWLYHPFGLLILHLLRKRKYWNVREFIMTYNEVIWKSITARQLSNSLRFSCSDDYTLAYLDITSFTKKIEEWDERPPLPLHILASGDGSFWNQYHLDTEDLMIQLLGWPMESEALELYQVFLHHFNQLLKTVKLDSPLPDKKQKEILALQKLVAKYNEELFHAAEYHLTLALFQAPMMTDKGKYVQGQWSGQLNSKKLEGYSLDLVNVHSKCLYSFKLGLIFTELPHSPKSPKLDVQPEGVSVLHYEPNSITLAAEQTSIEFVPDPTDSSEFSELSLRWLLLVPEMWNQYVVLFCLLLLIFIDLVTHIQSIAWLIFIDLLDNSNMLGITIYIGILPGANAITPLLSIVCFTQLILIAPRLIPGYISYQLVSCLSISVTIVYFLFAKPSWFWMYLLLAQLCAKVASLRLAALHKANIEAISFFEVTIHIRNDRRDRALQELVRLNGESQYPGCRFRHFRSQGSVGCL